MKAFKSRSRNKMEDYRLVFGMTHKIIGSCVCHDTEKLWKIRNGT